MKEVALDDARDDSGGLRAPRADKPKHAGDLSGENRKRRVPHHVLHRQVLYAEDLFSGRPHPRVVARATIKFIAQRPADHVANERFAREGFRVRRDDVGAVPEDGDAIGDIERFLQRMADEDDRNLLLAQSIDEREEMVLFLRREGCGRLIEDDDFGVETHRPRDLDHLALRGAERLDGRRGVDGEVEGLKKLLRLDIGAPQAVVEFLVAQIEI